MYFEQYNLLESTPHIVVDGNANAGTVLTLSHWPHSGTPKKLKDDLSAQIVFRYLDHLEFHVNVETVSNNHFDTDGLVSAFALVNPAFAQAHRELLIDVARADDFSCYRDRTALRIALTILAFANRKTSPLNASFFQGSFQEQTAKMYKEMIIRLPEIVTAPDEYRQYWETEDKQITTTEEAIHNGVIRIEEIHDIDLAIITLPDVNHPPYVENPKDACHQIGLYNALKSFCVVIIQRNYYELQYRYETWVQYQSVRPRPRADLTGLAGLLNSEEKNGVSWEFDGVDDIMPRLHLRDTIASTIAPERFREMVINYLRTAPPAWQQYDE